MILISSFVIFFLSGEVKIDDSLCAVAIAYWNSKDLYGICESFSSIALVDLVYEVCRLLNLILERSRNFRALNFGHSSASGYLVLGASPSVSLYSLNLAVLYG